ncbi:MAG: dTDP-4-dehydrorhamnose reductase [Thermoleophilia bacterium]|nr:dTDP-4-dehydrorhamnose reductase [Thermoleophilia bacterium]
MKAVVIGGNGQLGTDIVLECQRRGWEVLPLTHNDIQVEDPDSVRRVLNEIVPGVVFNTAAFHNVPQCETNPERAFRVNSVGSLNVTQASEAIGAISIYYSTDYVFDGSAQRPYREEDMPNPLNVYGDSKLAGEYCALNYTSRGLAVRVSGIYGKVPSRAKGGNFITTMVQAAREKPQVKVVDDERLSPTPTAEIARASIDLIEAGGTGLYHMVSDGDCSWYEFAKQIFATLGLETPLVPCASQEFPSPVRRPSYSVLENRRMGALGLPPMPDWQTSLIRFLKSEFDWALR